MPQVKGKHLVCCGKVEVLLNLQIIDVKPAVTAVDEAVAKQEAQQTRELSEEEKQMILLTPEFQRFFDQSTRIVERALSEHVDLFVDYTGVSDTESKV